MGASTNALIRACNCFHSSVVRRPVFSFSDSNSVSLAIKRVTSCTADISKEKIATVCLWTTAIFRAIDSTNAVFPIAGRAATITRSEGCQPAVTSSNATKPEGTPLMPSGLDAARSIPLIASSIIGAISAVSFLIFPSAISNTFFCALSIRSDTSVASSYASS